MTDSQALLLIGTEALAQGAWQQAREHFEAAIAAHESPEAHDGLSWAAWWLNDAAAVIRSREAAYRLYRQRGDDLSAARMAMWAGCDHIDFHGDVAVGRGWLSRARRILNALPVSAEHGWMCVVEAEASSYFDENMDAARRSAADAMTIGREIGSRDIEIVALASEGLAMVGAGDAGEGMRCLDEAAAAVLGGDLCDPIWCTKVLCYLIYACSRVRDFGRAAEWCEKMLTAAQTQQLTFTQGLCRTHYASVLISRGQWREAEAELGDAMSMLRHTRPAYLVEGTVRLAELRRRQGRFDEARAAFREAEWHPSALLGLAEIALDRGRPTDADDLVDRLLRQLPESSRLQRAIALELRVRVDALLGRHQRAAETLEVVRSLSDAVGTLPLRASANFSSGMLALAAGDFDRARQQFEDAVDLFDRSFTPYEAARARVELASVLVSLDRPERARDVATTAQAALERLGSEFFTRRVTALLENIDRRERAVGGTLTRRQVEILRLISRGMSDRAIAGKLRLSEHTVHRHVANILLRLNVPTRAAAAAQAARLGFL